MPEAAEEFDFHQNELRGPKMAAITGDVLLIVEREAKQTQQEITLAHRLEDALHCHVRIRSFDCDLPPKEEIGLVVIASRRAPPDIRKLDRPVLVCNAAALFEVGMTMAKQDVDFGYLDYSSVSIGPNFTGQFLPAAMMGRPKISEERAFQGWAKPGEKALVIATVGGDHTKAVAFAYNKGDAMPALNAAHRRGAFLAVGIADLTLTAEGWQLFDALVSVVAEGGEWAPDPGPAGQWFLRDGAPTRALSAQEYRDWVHEQVYNRVWTQLFRLFSLFGIGGLIAIGTIAAAFISGAIGTAVDDRVKKSQEKIEEEVRNQTAARVVDLLYQSKVGDEVKKNLKDSADKQFAALLNQQEYKDKLVQAAMQGLYEEGRMADGLMRVFNEGKVEENSAKRTLTLQLMFVYAANEKQREYLRKTAMDIVQNIKEQEPVRAAALDYYQPSRRFDHDEKDLDVVLNVVAKNLSSPVLTLSCARFISRFSDDHTEFLLTWVRSRQIDPHSDNGKELLAAIGTMKQKDPNNPRSLKAFVDLAVDRDRYRTELGIAGLTKFAKDHSNADLSKTTRHDALQKLLVRFNELEAQDAFILDTSLEAVAESRAKKALRPNLSAKGQLYSSILLSLLRANDEDKVQEWIGNGDRATSRAFQALMFNWVERLQLENENHVGLEKLYDSLLEVTDACYGEGTSRYLAYALRNCSDSRVETFWQKLPALYRGRSSQQFEFRGRPALVAALQRDASSRKAPLRQITQLMHMLDQPGAFGQDRSKEMKDELTEAVKDYYVRAERQFADLSGLRSVVQSQDPDKKHVQELFGVVLKQAYQRLIDKPMSAKKWVDLDNQLGEIITVDPDNPEWRFRRGALLVEKLREYKRAEEELTKAIKSPVASHDYFEALGDLYVRTENGNGAISAYQKANEGLVGTGNQIRRSQLFRKLALAHVLKNDKAAVEHWVMEAEKNAATALNKARAQEILGLFYLRDDNTLALAFENTTKVKKLSTLTPWNWIIRYIAAKALGNNTDAIEAERAWFRLRLRNDLGALVSFLPESRRKQFGIKLLKEDKLEPKERIRIPGIRGEKIADVHLYKMDAGKRYVLDMESTALDAYLVVEDANGNLLKFDDDSAGDFNARLEFSPPRSEQYRILATSFEGNGQGAYTLIIRETSEKQERAKIP
jgi:hypothetical protein